MEVGRRGFFRAFSGLAAVVGGVAARSKAAPAPASVASSVARTAEPQHFRLPPLPTHVIAVDTVCFYDTGRYRLW